MRGRGEPGTAPREPREDHTTAAKPDQCESCGVPLVLSPAGWIELWDLLHPKAPKSLPVHTPDRCQLLRAIAAMNRANYEAYGWPNGGDDR